MGAEKFCEVLARIMLVGGGKWMPRIRVTNQLVQSVPERRMPNVVEQRCCFRLQYQFAPYSWADWDAFSSSGLIQPIVAKHGCKGSFDHSTGAQCMCEPG